MVDFIVMIPWPTLKGVMDHICENEFVVELMWFKQNWLNVQWEVLIASGVMLFFAFNMSPVCILKNQGFDGIDNSNRMTISTWLKTLQLKVWKLQWDLVYL